MQSIASSSSAGRLFAASIVARLPPEGMLSIALLVHTQRLTGSFAAAGAVTGAFAIALGVGGPPLGRLVDRRGQTGVLVASASVATTLLLAIALLPAGAPLVVLVALAAGVGLSIPPVGACLRAQLPTLLANPSAVNRAYALETSLVELTYIFGPPLALCIGVLWSTRAALAIGGGVLLAGTAVFAMQPASRRWRPAPIGVRRRGGSLRTPTMRTLMIALIAVGALIGADEVAVTAAAKAVGGTSSAAPLFALWGAGSFVGGLIVTRLGTARSAAGLVLWLGALAAGHLALIPADTSVLELAAVLLVAGAAIAPTEAAVYAMVEDAAPAGTITEAFAWLATAMAVGGAIGAAGAGALADSVGPAAAFAFGGCAGASAVLTTALRSRTLDRRKASALDRRTGGPATVIHDMPEPIRQTEGELCLRATSQPRPPRRAGGSTPTSPPLSSVSRTSGDSFTCTVTSIGSAVGSSLARAESADWN